MTPLPIDQHLSLIVHTLRERRALVLVAEPGAGKTTRVAPAILRAGLLARHNPNLILLQPRRVAARAAAIRIADENRWRVGQEVGWHVRFDRRLGPQTRLRVLTEGILTRQLIDDPLLEGVGCVVLDEFHERSIHTDLAIALLNEVRQTVRDDLLLVVMSATLDARPVAQFLGDCPIIQAPGRVFPIETTHAAAPSARDIEDRIAEALEAALARSDGDVLIFLPGVEEIRRTIQRIDPIAQQSNLLVLPLHGTLSAEEQIRALQPADRRKVIVATNIAETSLTIDGVRVVIDSGLARVAGYDAQRGLDRLDVKFVSKASATQRAGRAGRTAPGTCLRLYTSRQFHAMDDFELPEVRRVDLAGTVLALHAWGKSDPRQFGWFDPPPEHLIASAERLLTMLGALDAESNGRITELGRRMNALPVHPRLARLLIAAAEHGKLEIGAIVAAILSEKDFVQVDRQARTPKTQGQSDLSIRLELLAAAERAGFNPAGIDDTAARQVVRTRDELMRIARSIRAKHKQPRHDPEEALLRFALLAYPDRVCRRRENDPSAGVMVGGGGVRLAAESVVRKPPLFVALDARHDHRSTAREALVRLASGIEFEWLEEFFPHQIRRQRTLVFDEQRQRVAAMGTTCYLDLVLREDRDAPVDPQLAGQVLADVLEPRARKIIESNEPAATWLARVDLLRRAMPEHNWPAFDDAELGKVLREMCRGRRSVEELDRTSPLPFLQGRLRYPLDRMLDEHAPQAITVPSGSRIRLKYDIGQPPVLAVRLQELFGWTDTPRIAGGRVPVVLHLLSPSHRPVQITDDLRSFWTTTYFQVRKDLRVRYPKHSWPEDPCGAKPPAKGGRHRTAR